jgi:hypothetical protein
MATPRFATYVVRNQIIRCVRTLGLSSEVHYVGNAVFKYAGTLVRPHGVHDVFVEVSR